MKRQSPLLSVQAPAKINLSLRILGKRSDGFHELETIMAPVSLFDTLVFSESAEFSFSCDDASVPLDEGNLVVKAVRIFEREAGLLVRLAVHLEKRIPHGAGLGGGSSDAAMTLDALNRLYGTELSREKLAEMASELGSDVPFFLYKSQCLCTGRGECISPLPAGERVEGELLLIKPSFGVPTASAYGLFAHALEIEGFDYGVRTWSGCSFVNDLERPVFAKYLFLGVLKHWLLAQVEVHVSMMSGSGSTVFAFIDGAKFDFDAFSEKLRQKFGASLRIFRVKTC